MKPERESILAASYVGVDEAGRGTWAGPLVAAAVAVPANWSPLPQVRDSKKLSKTQIIQIAEHYIDSASVQFNIAVIPPEVIDTIGVGRAQTQAHCEAILGVARTFETPVIVDGIEKPPGFNGPVFAIPKADADYPAVSLASILAKYTQMTAMRDLDTAFPGYGFAKHCGYGTKEHEHALARLGACPAHRKSFTPIKNLSTTWTAYMEETYG